MENDPLYGKRVAVIGFNRQGRALARWLPSVGAEVLVNDRRSEDEFEFNREDYPHVDFLFGKHPAELVNEVDVVCVSGGVPLTIPIVQSAFRHDVRVVNDAQLFMERCPAPIIGITGSAGKTTTTTLIGQIIESAGYRTWVGGNIGNVLLDNLADIRPEDCVVMELSSFQLELMTSSPQIAVVLNVTPNHLDRHITMENYLNAKANILRYQRPQDVAILCKDDPGSRSLEVLVEGELAWFSMNEMVPDGAFVTGRRIMLAGAASFDYIPHVLCKVSDIPLRGSHNILNVLAACTVAGTLGLVTNRPGIPVETMRQIVKSFVPVPHRLEKVAEINGVTYINDGIATAPERVTAALESFDENIVLLLGGADKDLPWENTLNLALRKSRHIVLFGAEGEKQVRTKVRKILQKNLSASQQITMVDTLDQAVNEAAQLAEDGDIVLFSPGGTSYDAYNNFEERGEHFRELVAELMDSG